MNSLVQFLASMNGRILRAVAGIVLIVLGWAVGDTAGWIIAIIGLIPLAAGVFDFCLLAPLMGLPFWGRDIRRRTR
ncbi:MAG: DUF2892 domain-containing protein [Chloroflexota bacterium]|jgi:hypothetical protein|nr:DUF2892 domain-containing protein [Anaerolineae bacterium]HMM29889.1 DUF2892 domain-containing protein [Aggregatilineaceae bacterium]